MTARDLSPPLGPVPSLTRQNALCALELPEAIFQRMIFVYLVCPVQLQNHKLHNDGDNVHFIYTYTYQETQVYPLTCRLYTNKRSFGREKTGEHWK